MDDDIETEQTSELLQMNENKPIHLIQTTSHPKGRSIASTFIYVITSVWLIISAALIIKMISKNVFDIPLVLFIAAESTRNILVFVICNVKPEWFREKDPILTHSLIFCVAFTFSIICVDQFKANQINNFSGIVILVAIANFVSIGILSIRVHYNQSDPNKKVKRISLLILKITVVSTMFLAIWFYSLQIIIH